MEVRTGAGVTCVGRGEGCFVQGGGRWGEKGKLKDKGG